jgi:GxxExxY protein
MADIIYKEESYKIIGACFEVHKQLGPGFLESVYSEALAHEFQKTDIPYEMEKKLDIYYGDQLMKKYFKADFICYNKIILELKATDMLIKAHVQQITNNVKATNFQLGLLINFGSSSLTYKRIVNSYNSRNSHNS